MLYTIICIAIMMVIWYVSSDIMMIIGKVMLYGINVTLDKIASMLIGEEIES